MADDAMQLNEDELSIPPWNQQYSLDLRSSTVSSGSDHDEKITPRLLCELCLRVVAEYTRNHLWRDNEDADFRYESSDDEHRIDFEGQSVTHHGSIPSLHISAEQGCHLCSLLIKPPGIYEKRFETSTVPQLEVMPRHREERTIYRNGTQKIWLDLQYVSVGECLTVTHMFRYPHASSQVTIRNGQDSLSEHYRWCKSTSAQVGFDMLRGWIQRCLQEHDTCRWKLSSTKPARLLDLSAFQNSDDLCLVLSDEAQTVEYATLSYRWVGSNPLTLKTTNYSELKTRIRFGTLSRTIQEAIREIEIV